MKSPAFDHLGITAPVGGVGKAAPKPAQMSFKGKGAGKFQKVVQGNSKFPKALKKPKK